LNLLHDTYGAFRENELLVGYASRIRLTKNHNLRLGAALNYQSIRLDGNSLTTEEASDPTLSQYVGTFSDMSVVDFNMGIALTHRNYYFSYGVQRINGGKISSGDQFMDGYSAEQMIQAGFRESLSPDMAVIVNGFFRSRKDLENLMELNIKVLAMNKFWVGGGHRIDYASNLQLGFLAKQLRLGYVYEFPTGKRNQMPGTTHEITASFKLFPLVRNKSNQYDVVMW
jgi:type IX secretion system PorP/SprF family membrane protein